jgi:D-proline reductase (dithiol) PrdB
MDVIEKIGEFNSRFSRWNVREDLARYPFVENRKAPFTPLRRALPLLNLGLISSAGAFITGTEGFEVESRDGDAGICEIPIEVGPEALSYAAKGYDPGAVKSDRNSQIPIDRLLEYQSNAVLGQLNNVWWSLSSWIPNAVVVAQEVAPALTERLHRYGVQAALLVPASRLCHQTLGILARAIETSGIPTMMLSVDPGMSDRVRPPRTAYYMGDLGSVAGKPHWREYQLRILDEALRWIETFDQPGSRKLAVDLETQVEAARGER